MRDDNPCIREVTYSWIVGPDGGVRDARIVAVSGHDGFTEREALAIERQRALPVPRSLRMEPGRMEGHPVAMRVRTGFQRECPSY